MRRGVERVSWFLLVAVAPALAVTVVAAAPDGSADPARAEQPPIPLDDHLVYSVHWMGLRCGTMTMDSFVDDSSEAGLYRIVLTARSSKFFDGIYKVRARLESWFDGERMSSIRYRDHSIEKKKVKDDLFELDLDAGAVKRTKNGEISQFTIDHAPVHDPLAFVYRIRALAARPGDHIRLRLITSKAALDTVAYVQKEARIRTSFGPREVLRIEPRPESGILFSKSGEITLWVGRDEARTPFKIAFDLYFGRLVARLIAIEPPGEHQPLVPPFDDEGSAQDPPVCRTGE